MAKEIERKFLVQKNMYQAAEQGVYIRQGYICAEKERVVRIRIYGEKAFLTIKNASIGFSRDEFEYEIPIQEAQTMLSDVCLQPTIEKIRTKILFEGFYWDVDWFLGENNGLILAEIELPDENTPFLKPDWVGEEVTEDVRYYNANLFKNPYCNWSK